MVFLNLLKIAMKKLQFYQGDDCMTIFCDTVRNKFVNQSIFNTKTDAINNRKIGIMEIQVSMYDIQRKT